MLQVLRNQLDHRAWDWEDLRRAALAASLQVLGSRQDAEDAAQEAIVRAWRARSRCQADGSPYPWVGRIARNEALRLGAGVSRRQRLEADLLAAVGRGASDGAARDDGRRSAVVCALSELTPRDAELVRLRYVEDLKYSVIAERLGMPLGTVKVRLHRLHNWLRSVTADEGIPRDI